MAPADRAYRVRPASAADLPAVLAILAENQAEPPRAAAPWTGYLASGFTPEAEGFRLYLNL